MKLVRITKEEAVRIVGELGNHEDSEIRRVVDRIAKKFKLLTEAKDGR